MALGIALGMGLTPSALAQATVTVDVPPHRSFFPMNDALARRISQVFGVAIEAGLYFTPQSTELLAHEFRGPTYRPQLPNYDASYLAADGLNHFLYGARGWKVRGLRRIVREGDRVARVEALTAAQELAVDVAWIQRPREIGGRLVRQLWVSRKNGERWLLLEDDGGRHTSNRFLWIPSYFLPLEDGVIAFPANWVVSRRPFVGSLAEVFPLVTTVMGREQTRPDTQFTVATVNASLGRDTRRMPLLVHNVGERKILFAGWANDGDRETYNLRRSRPIDDSRLEADLFVWDLTRNRIHRLLSGLRWPFHLALSGVFGGIPVRHRAFNWGENSNRYDIERWLPVPIQLGTFRVDYSYDTLLAVQRNAPNRRHRIVAGTGVGDALDDTTANSRPPAQPVLAEIERWGSPPDLLNELRLGSRHPMSYVPHVTERLVRLLSQQRSWAIFLYNQGDSPTELLTGALRAVDTEAVPASMPLQNLDNVFQFHSDRFFGRLRRAELREALPQLRRLVEGTRAVVYLDDYPASLESLRLPLSDDDLRELITRLDNFRTEFRECISNGTCRVVMSMRQELYDAIPADDRRRLFDRASPVQFDPGSDITLALRRKIARLYAQKYELIFGAALAEDAFARAFTFTENLPQAVRDENRIPGRYDSLFLDLFSFASIRAVPRDPRVALAIDRALVTQFETERTQRPRLELRAYRWTPDSAPRPTFFWEPARRDQVMPAFTGLHDQVWRENPSHVLWSTRFSHALLGIPGRYSTSELEGRPGREGAVDILLPPNRIVRALDFLPELTELGLHPQGFYFLSLQERQLNLCFFRLTPPRDESPVRILWPARGEAVIPVQDYEQGLLRVVFRNDVVEVTRRNGSTEVFGPSGRLSPMPLGGER